MQPAITVAVIAATVSVIGWMVNYVLSLKSERERGHLSARLSHVERQLEALYGPLAFLVYEGRRSFLDLLDELGRNYIFRDGEELGPDELELWLFYVDRDFMPRNIAIKDLLSSRTHLVLGNSLPPSYVRFLDHHNSWSMQHQLWKERKVPYNWHSKINWPREFEDDVISAFEHLMEEHARLIGIIGGAELSSRTTAPLRRPRRMSAP